MAMVMMRIKQILGTGILLAQIMVTKERNMFELTAKDCTECLIVLDTSLSHGVYNSSLPPPPVITA